MAAKGGKKGGHRDGRGSRARPKAPYWSCGKYGETDNFCWSEACKGRGGTTPAMLRRFAQAATKTAAALQAGKPSLSKTQGPHPPAGQKDEVTQLRAELSALERAVKGPAASPAAAADEEGRAYGPDGPTVAQLQAA